MKKLTILTLIFMLSGIINLVNAQSKKSSGSSTYESAVGVHLGEPFAVNYRKYSDKTAWEVALGVTRRSFGYDNYSYLTSRPRFDEYWLSGQTFSPCLTAQFHYLFHYDLKALEGFKIYWGFGPQFRFRTYEVTGTRKTFPWDTDRYVGADIDLGLDVVIGADYKFKKLPLAVFADIVPFTEFVDRFYVYPMGGIGARYTF